MRLIPATVIALALLTAQLRQINPALSFPIIFAATCAVFYFALHITGESISEAQATGWMFTPSNVGGRYFMFWPHFVLHVQQVHWAVIWTKCSKTIICLCVLMVLKMSLSVPAIEKAVEKKLDGSKEMATFGASYAVVGLLGGCGATPTISTIMMVKRMQASDTCRGAFMVCSSRSYRAGIQYP
jgi:MFS superfamily sulfate permease-like transporter